MVRLKVERTSESDNMEALLQNVLLNSIYSIFMRLKLPDILSKNSAIIGILFGLIGKANELLFDIK